MEPPSERLGPPPRAPQLWKRRLLSSGRELAIAVLVLLGISLAFVFFLPRIPEAIDEAKLIACEQNLGMIHKFAADHARVHGNLPAASGEAFYEALFPEYPGESLLVEQLHCPGVVFEHLPSREALYRGYAFRDNIEFPARLGDPDRALAACGNLERQNHPDVTLVLMADGTIRSFSLVKLREQGTLPAEEKSLLVGADSPLTLLRELRH